MGIADSLDISPSQRKTLVSLLNRHIPGVTVWAYGSRVKWTSRPDSDLDLVAFVSPEKRGRISALKEAFEESSLPFRVDLMVWDEVPENFRKNILQQYLVLVEKPAVKPQRDLAVSEWRPSTWGEEISLEYGKSLRGYENTIGQYRVFGSNGPIGWTDEFLTQGPGVILGRKGAYRGVHFSQDPFFVIDTAYYVVPKTELDMRWLYYAIKHYKLGEIDDGSPIPSTTRAAVYIQDLEVPPPDEQRAIAHILGTLDDKIELNRRMNETLEAMARALFKSWFVDFDPVRAKAEGRDTGLPKEIADLFPDSFEDSELGEVPKGWRVASLGDVADNIRRNIQPDDIPPSTPYIGLEHMPRRCIALSDWGEPEELESNKHVFKRGEMLFGKLRPYFHKMGVAAVDGVCSTDIVVIASKKSEWFGFTLGHISSVEFVDYTNAGSTGTKMPRTSWHEMARYPVVLPQVNIADRYTGMIRPMVDQIAANIHESRTLAAQRDALLPKLLSGELVIVDAERHVGRAV